MAGKSIWLQEPRPEPCKPSDTAPPLRATSAVPCVERHPGQRPGRRTSLFPDSAHPSPEQDCHWPRTVTTTRELRLRLRPKPGALSAGEERLRLPQTDIAFPCLQTSLLCPAEMSFRPNSEAKKFHTSALHSDPKQSPAVPVYLLAPLCTFCACVRVSRRALGHMASLPDAKADEKLVQSIVYTFPNNSNSFLMASTSYRSLEATTFARNVDEIICHRSFYLLNIFLVESLGKRTRRRSGRLGSGRSARWQLLGGGGSGFPGKGPDPACWAARPSPWV